MMDYTRHTTMCEIKGLSQEELDYHFDENSNSIGMLLYHMASLEKAFQIMTFEARDLTDEEWEELSVGIVLGEDAKQEIRGKDLAFYEHALENTRLKTLNFLAAANDEWLEHVTPYGWDHPANNYFKWFHVFEDELNHRGQIRMIKKRFRVT
ncbi:DinB family protein [Rossellomorea sp. KS-H15a]|uniref:DinB family protein n=1 Tax=Rossellomorea sp. KS-H15a TaxID=2963940 RepID=UPI0020C716C4|nr:DinB family protein [Rossellomorea sp. KS-H15a]UTE79349.1 DinB family protein [Rossellomorea sp. KS-H15a]